MLFYLQVNSPDKANIAKVVPTPNNGCSELVKIHHNEGAEPWFIFQKTKYVWDSDKKQFSSVQFPVDHTVGYYNNWKGYADDAEIKEAEEIYGKNK